MGFVKKAFKKIKKIAKKALPIASFVAPFVPGMQAMTPFLKIGSKMLTQPSGGGMGGAALPGMLGMGAGYLAGQGGGGGGIPAPQLSQMQIASQNLAAQRALMPQVMQLERQYRPQMMDLNLGLAEQAMPRLGALGRREGAANIAGFTSSFARQAPQYAETIRRLNPELYGTLGLMSEQYKQAGTSDIQDELTRQALEDVKLRGQLSGEEERMAQQAAREASGARGRQMDLGAMGSEILSRDQFARAREAQRRQFALQADTQRMQQEEMNRRFGLGVGQLGLGAKIDPTAAFSGLYSRGLSSAPSFGQMTGGPTLFNPLDPYGTSIQTGNVQRQLDAQIAAASNRAAQRAAMMSAGGQILSAPTAGGGSFGGNILGNILGMGTGGGGGTSPLSGMANILKTPSISPSGGGFDFGSLMKTGGNILKSLF